MADIITQTKKKGPLEYLKEGLDTIKGVADIAGTVDKITKDPLEDVIPKDVPYVSLTRSGAEDTNSQPDPSFGNGDQTDPAQQGLNYAAKNSMGNAIKRRFQSIS